MMDRLSEALLILVVGMGGVLGSLLFFYFVITLINKLEEKFLRWQKAKSLKPVKIRPTELKESALEEVEIDDDELTAILTAAAFASTHADILVTRIRFLKQPTVTSWSTIGKMNLIGSHIIQKSN